MDLVMWNLWHGCSKVSAGCMNCYMFDKDYSHNCDPNIVKINKTTFQLPIAKNRQGTFKYPSGTNFIVNLTSDTFIEKADEWRETMWKIIALRRDCNFVIPTKRMRNAFYRLPEDWCDGYHNVAIASSCENQAMSDERLHYLKIFPCKHKLVFCTPLLEKIDLREYLSQGFIEHVIVGGENGDNARPCDYDWVLDICHQCIDNNVSFTFRDTGTHFIKDGRSFKIYDSNTRKAQAKKANIDFVSR